MNKKYKVVLFGLLAYALANEQYKQRQALKLMLKGMTDQQKILEILNENQAATLANHLKEMYEHGSR